MSIFILVLDSLFVTFVIYVIQKKINYYLGASQSKVIKYIYPTTDIQLFSILV